MFTTRHADAGSFNLKSPGYQVAGVITLIFLAAVCATAALNYARVPNLKNARKIGLGACSGPLLCIITVVCAYPIIL